MMIGDYWLAMETSRVMAMLSAINIVGFPPRASVTSAAQYGLS